MSSKLLQQTNDGILQQTGAGNFILLNGAAETWHLTQENEWGIILEDSSGYLVTQSTFNMNCGYGTFTLTGFSITELYNRILNLSVGTFSLTGFAITLYWHTTAWVGQLKSAISTWINRPKES